MAAGLWEGIRARNENLGNGLWVGTSFQSGVIPKVTAGGPQNDNIKISKIFNHVLYSFLGIFVCRFSDVHSKPGRRHMGIILEIKPQRVLSVCKGFY